MKSLNNYLGLLLLLAISFTACEPENNNYTIPETYNFSNVDYSGQSTRLAKLGAIITYAKTAHVSGATALDAAKLKDMFGANTGNHFTDTTLNAASSKQLKDKTIASEQSNFESYMDALATASTSTSMAASDGQAGIAANNAGNKFYLLNANGIELTQIIEKGLMGACLYYQATAVYMGSGKMDVDNTTVNPGQGTTMEHHWDEAFGYFGVPIDFPTSQTGAVYWGKYCNTHEAVYPLNTKMMNAFLKGRAAISAKDLTTRDAMITELRKQWELVVAATAIYYLNNAKANLGVDNAVAYHELSEVFGFIMSLKYGAAGTITNAQVDTILTNLFGNSNPLSASTYTVDNTKIEAAKTALVGYFTDLSAVKDSL